MERKLAAILASDVVGYSKLMAADETGTLAALKDHRDKIFNPITTRYNGRIVKLMGDGVLVEFASVVGAVECAIAIQQAVANIPDSKIILRIGVNLGDVIIEGDDIYGDGVNVAARLEALAHPGGLCVSSVVHESLGNRLEVGFADAGEHQVKNIERSIRVFRWPAGHEETQPCAPTGPPTRFKPTIAILPFVNRSSDEELTFFCEGVAEDITAAIGTVSQLTVVSRQAGAEKTDEQPGAVAHYTLEGSVRKSGNRIRVSTHLLDNFAGVQCWAERFDRTGDDMFEIQDDLAKRIVIAVHTELGAGSYTNRWQHGTNNFEAWRLQATGFHEFQKWTPDSMEKCAAIWAKVSDLDPDYLAPRMARAYALAHIALWSDAETAEALVAEADEAVQLALAAAPDDPRPYSPKRGIEIARGNYDAAIEAAKKGLALAPQTGAGQANLALAYMSAGLPEEALVQLTKAIQDIPNYPGWFAMVKIQSHYMLGDFEEGLREAESLLAGTPDFQAGAALKAALQVELGLTDEAVKTGRVIRQQDPGFSVARFVQSQGLKDQHHADRLKKALFAAELPA